MNSTVKHELTSVSNWLGFLVGVIGNVLPYLTPGTLTALGFTGPWVQRISTAVGLLLIAYREKPKAAPVLPPPAPEVTRSPFVQSPPEKSP